MKTAIKLALAVIMIYLGSQFFRTDEFTQEDKPITLPNGYNPNVVAYDWENDRNITKQDMDTLQFTGGHWIKREKERDTIITWYTDNGKIHNWDWIRPTGRYKPEANSPLERQWIYFHEKLKSVSQPIPLDEDRVREIVREEQDW